MRRQRQIKNYNYNYNNRREGCRRRGRERMGHGLKLDDGGVEHPLELQGPEPGEALDVGIALGKAGEALDGLIQGADSSGG
jgi:hypothetical protein